MEIVIIAAMAANRVIGDHGRLPWRLPLELQRFKRLTMGHTLIMGRRTFDSIGHPLAGRRNIVVSRNPAWSAPGCETAPGLDEALALARGAQKVFVIGGAEIFRLALGRCDTIILTVLEREVAGDVLFPEFSSESFVLAATEQVRDEEPYRIETHCRT